MEDDDCCSVNEKKEDEDDESASKKKAKPRRWTDAEDAALCYGVEKYGERRWKAIAAGVGTRDHMQCLQRWKKVLKRGLVKDHWTPEEDDVIRDAVQQHQGDGFDWQAVAAKLPLRSARECRERYKYALGSLAAHRKGVGNGSAVAAQRHLGPEFPTTNGASTTTTFDAGIPATAATRGGLMTPTLSASHHHRAFDATPPTMHRAPSFVSQSPSVGSGALPPGMTPPAIGRSPLGFYPMNRLASPALSERQPLASPLVGVPPPPHWQRNVHPVSPAIRRRDASPYVTRPDLHHLTQQQEPQQPPPSPHPSVPPPSTPGPPQDLGTTIEARLAKLESIFENSTREILSLKQILAQRLWTTGGTPAAPHRTVPGGLETVDSSAATTQRELTTSASESSNSYSSVSSAYSHVVTSDGAPRTPSVANGIRSIEETTDREEAPPPLERPRDADDEPPPPWSGYHHAQPGASPYPPHRAYDYTQPFPQYAGYYPQPHYQATDSPPPPHRQVSNLSLRTALSRAA